MQNTTKEEMNKAYKDDCKRQLRERLIRELDNVLDSESINPIDKDWALGIVSSILIKVQLMK